MRRRIWRKIKRPVPPTKVTQTKIAHPSAFLHFNKKDMKNQYESKGCHEKCDTRELKERVYQECVEDFMQAEIRRYEMKRMLLVAEHR